MLHLTVEEIIEFVSAENISDDTMVLIKKVNSHISQCDKCREKVDAFMSVSDELFSLLGTENVKGMLYQLIKDDQLQIFNRKEIDDYLAPDIDITGEKSY